MKRYEALPDADGTLNEIEDLIWKTFTLDHIPPAFTVKLRRILAGLATDQGAVEALREAWLGEKSDRRYALHGPTHNCAPEICQIGQCPAIRALLSEQ